MKKSFIKIVLLLSLLVSSFSFTSTKLYVGTNAEFEPFEYLKDGKIVGFDIELMEEVSKLIGKEIEVKNLAFDGLLPALQSKKIDIIIAGMTATDDRKKFVNFSDAYYSSEQMIVLNKESDVNIKNFEELSGKQVGVVLGFTGDIAVSKVKDAKVVRFNGTGEAVMALKSKRVDVIVLDAEPAKKYAAQNEELIIKETEVAKEEYAIAIRKDDPALLEEINKALSTLKENGKYAELMKKYDLLKD
ncbi:basic amino acid ABC transporter substrate-binding protein [Fusobacterium sp. PH5-44]|uniref:basic amino acid ABC transporter substrate-binding protein n=1 Tax=unclassified Fusobacterium TaxID=2648384 RepID=UPI003D26180F